MSGAIYIDYRYTPSYDTALAARQKNARNKRSASQLLKELESSINESKKRGADKYAKDELDKAEKLHDSLKANISTQSYAAVVDHESEVKQRCEVLENQIVTGMQQKKKALEEQRRWSILFKKMLELERKIKPAAAPDDLVMKWKKEEWSAYSLKLEMARANIDQKSGNPEEVFYQLRDMEKEYDEFVQESSRLEELSIEREMLIETIEYALGSPELQFDVHVNSEDGENPYSTLVLKAWRPNEEMIEMRFDLDKGGRNTIDVFATGFAEPGYPSGCDSVFDSLEQQLSSCGLQIVFHYYDDESIHLHPQEQYSISIAHADDGPAINIDKYVPKIGRRLPIPEQQSRHPAELLHFSAFAPPIVKPQSRFVLYIWTFMETQRDTMLVLASPNNTFKQIGTKGPIRAQRGTELTICVDLPDFKIDETIDKIIWEGEISSASFAVSVPEDIEPGKHVCKAKILCGGIQLARLFFEIEVGLEQESSKALKTEEQRIRTVFASYASEDRLEVLRWARGAQTVGVDVFLDVLSLREGQYWEKELWKHIPSKDLFCLFWSEPASRSPWVEKEWKCALVARGLDYIHPVPLVDPRKVPPPKELSVKHFNDLTRIIIEYEQAFRTNSASS